MTLAELRTKEVIDVHDGKRLGRVMDIEFCTADSTFFRVFQIEYQLVGIREIQRKKGEWYLKENCFVRRGTLCRMNNIRIDQDTLPGMILTNRRFHDDSQISF